MGRRSSRVPCQDESLDLLKTAVLGIFSFHLALEPVLLEEPIPSTKYVIRPQRYHLTPVELVKARPVDGHFHDGVLVSLPVLLQSPRSLLHVEHRHLARIEPGPHVSAHSGQRVDLVLADVHDAEARVVLSRVDAHFPVAVTEKDLVRLRREEGPRRHVAGVVLNERSDENLELCAPVQRRQENP